MNNQITGIRLRALREKRNLTQADFAQFIGFKDNQIVSDIENGDRLLTIEEMELAVKKLDISDDYFFDPFLIAGEGSFSWRQSGLETKQLSQYELIARQLDCGIFVLWLHWLDWNYHVRGGYSDLPVIRVLKKLGMLASDSCKNST